MTTPLRIIERFNSTTRTFDRCRMNQLQPGDIFRYLPTSEIKESTVQFRATAKPFRIIETGSWGIEAEILPVLNMEEPAVLFYTVSGMNEEELCGKRGILELTPGRTYRLSHDMSNTYRLTESPIEESDGRITIVGELIT